MSKIKLVRQLIALALVFCIINSFAVLTFAQEVKSTNVGEKVVNPAYEEAVNTLIGLQIIKGGTDNVFEVQNNMTRAEFVAVLVRLLGFEDISNSIDGDMIFNDVVTDYWAYGSIKLAKNLGIVSGDTNNNFEPDKAISYEQVIKMLVSVLGYDLVAQSKGGYPIGYTTIANEKGITKNLSFANSTSVTSGDVAVMLYNSLSVELMQKTGYGDDIKYTITPDKTLLTERLNIIKKSGIVTGNMYTALYNNSNISNDEIEIDGITYANNHKEYSDFIGYNVNYYYKENKNNGVNTIIYMTPNKSKNNILTIKAEEIDNYSNHTYAYWSVDDNRKLQKAEVSLKADVIYNGGILSVYNDGKFRPNKGKVLLLDNNNDNIYDIVFITSVVDYVVKNISDNIIYDKYNANLKLDLAPNGINVMYVLKDISGKEINLSDLEEWDVLSVAKSEIIQSNNKVIYNIIRSNKTVVGKIDEICTKNNFNEDTLVINGEDYLLDKDFNAYLQTNKKTFKVGDEGTFYLDSYNKIVAFSSKNNTSLIGYLVTAAYTKNSLDKIAEFKIFTLEGKFVILKSAEKIEINDNRVDCKVAIDFLPKNTNDNINQMVKYSTNDNDEITEIETAIIKDSTYIGRDKFNKKVLSTDTRYKWTPMSFAGQINMNSSTKVFIIPTDLTKEDLFNVSNTSYFKEDGVYTVDGYYLKLKDLEATAVAVYNNDGNKIKAGAEAVYVKKISQCIDNEGMGKYKITFLKNASEINYFVKETVNIAALNIDNGDVIRYHLNADNEIDNIHKCFDVSDSKLYDVNENVISNSYSSADYAADYAFIYGDIDLKDGRIIQVTSGALKEINYRWDTGKIYVYDSSVQKDLRLYVGSESDIVDGQNPRQKVLIHLQNAMVYSILIIK